MVNKWQKVIDLVLTGQNQGWKKLVKNSVALHKTAFPKTQPELERLGVRFDFAGQVEEGGKTLNRFEVQVNDGQKIPSSWKKWRESHKKGTHGVVAIVKVPDGGTKEDVKAALDAVNEEIKD